MRTSPSSRHSGRTATKKRARVLALAVYPISAAATRFRLAALEDALRDREIELTLATSLDDAALRVLYQPGALLHKSTLALRSTVRQWARSIAEGPWDAVFVQREAALVGPPVLEWALSSLGHRPLVFDFDDAIWLSTASASRNPLAARLLRNPAKAHWLMRRAAHVIAGSEYLADAARRHNPNVTVVPTVVSRMAWAPAAPLDGALKHPEEPVIGFVGTHSTAEYLHIVVPALQLPIEREEVEWNLAGEINLFRDLDIGIAPMPENEWTWGKCAFKQIQYLSVGVPCVTSPVGAAADLVARNVALGASTSDEWYAQLQRLLDDNELRTTLTQRGRALVETDFCTEIQAPRAAGIIASLTPLQRGARDQRADGRRPK